MSRNLTKSVERNSANPKAKKNNCNIFRGVMKAKLVNDMPENSANIITTTRFIPSDINELIIADKTTMYFGKLIFRKISPRPTIEFIPTFVASVKKLQRDIPSNRTIGYCGVPSVNFKKRTNTVYITANNISGFNTDHRIPKNEP